MQHEQYHKLTYSIKPTVSYYSKDEVKVTNLPFVKDIKKTKKKEAYRSFWNVKPTDDYGVDCRTGGEYAIEYYQYRLMTGDGHSFLTWIISEMPKDLTGIEVGFLSTLDDLAISGAITKSN